MTSDQRRRAGRTIDYVADPALSFWPTPPEVADDLVYRALETWHLPFGEGVRVLEPSAGDGHLAAAVRSHLRDAHITCVEPSRERADRLRQLPGVADEVVESTLEEYLVQVAFAAMAGEWQPFNLVVMNPPFTLEGRPEAWAEHVLALLDDPYVLAPGGTLSAIAPHIVKTGKSRLVRKVRERLSPLLRIEECERGAFDPVGAGVSAVMLLIEQPWDAEV